MDINNKHNKPELLGPLNSWKSIAPQTNVLKNADAVYLGLDTNFSMRARAINFSPKDLKKVVQKIHQTGKKCYLTTNILIYNTELVELHQSIELAYKSGIDAIICHDIATIMIAKKFGIPFHISTQANISNKISAKFYQSLGAERIILARELNLDDIKKVIKEVSIPVECFIHGAMCTAVSGRCYLSADLMGYDQNFSANRGKCVQPCRRKYEIQNQKILFEGEEKEKFEYERFSGMFFSAKDLCMIGHIPELIESGISSFKIEGRMRDPLYISETTSCYREAIDSYYEGTYSQDKIDKWLKRLKKVFNRGFHTGFYFQKPGIDEIQKNIRGNVSKWHKVLVGKVKNYYKKAKAVEIQLYIGKLKVGNIVIFENKADFFYKQTIKSMQFNGNQINESKIATKNQNIPLGIKVESKIPINSNVYLYKIKRK